MANKVLTLLLLLMSPFVALAKFTISGKVLNAADQKPVQGATVFLANAFGATKTDKDGTFTLKNVSGGQYELVISTVGYKASGQIVSVNNNIKLKDVSLLLTTTQDKDINAKPDSEWVKNYNDFKSKFLGNGEFTGDCKILNPQVIKLRYDRRSVSLVGSSSDFIIIENRALGYRIKYLLLSFQASFEQKLVSYSGLAYFENLAGDSSIQAQWKVARLNVYLGSSMHFLRSALTNQLSANGFVVRPVVIQPNPYYKDEPFGKKYSASLVNSLLKPDEFMRPTTDSTLHALIFSDALYVTYSREPVKDTTFSKLAPATVVILNKRYAAFDNNGVFTDPSAITFDGIWGQNYLPRMLPVDYEPGK